MKDNPGPNRAQPTERGTRPLSTRPLPPVWDAAAERRRRDLADVLREERSRGARRIYLEAP